MICVQVGRFASDNLHFGDYAVVPGDSKIRCLFMHLLQLHEGGFIAEPVEMAYNYVITASGVNKYGCLHKPEQKNEKN